MTETVLVTGGAGYIGSHVCKSLAGHGIEPVTYDNLSQGHRWAVSWGPLEIGDIEDGARLDAVLEKHRPDAVIHLASSIAAGESVEEPERYYTNNTCGLLTLLAAMRRHHVDHIVFSSSAAVYGTPDRIPIREETPANPVNPYGWTKAFGEQILRDYAAAYGLRSVSLRYFNAAGADPDGELGEAHDPETHLIPLVLEAAAGLRPQIDIYGARHRTRDGTCVRDYIHVSDLATAHVLALRGMSDGPCAASYNLGTGRGYTVSEIVRTAERVTGCPIPTRVCPPRPGDPPILLADPARAMARLAWNPAYPDIETVIAHAWRWLGRRASCEPDAAESACASSPVAGAVD